MFVRFFLEVFVMLGWTLEKRVGRVNDNDIKRGIV